MSFRIVNSPAALRSVFAIAATSLLLTFVVIGDGGLVAPSYAADGASLRFSGVGADELDRVMVPLGPLDDGKLTASLPVNVGGDFTLEFWIKATPGANRAPVCDNGWYYGNIILDRDVDGAGDEGDYGIAICDERIAFGVSVGDDDRRLIGAVPVTDGQWHHIAVTRADGGLLAMFVDGQPAGSTEGPRGSVAYRINRETAQPDSDPYLVLGAEKHGYPGTFHYDGLLDDLRISNVVRYSGMFARPVAPHQADANTVALYSFDEGAGLIVGDSSGAPGGPSDGQLVVAGSPASPAWSADTPFAAPSAAPSPEAGAPSAAPSATAPVAATLEPSATAAVDVTPTATLAPAATILVVTAAPPMPTQTPQALASDPSAPTVSQTSERVAEPEPTSGQGGSQPTATQISASTQSPAGGQQTTPTQGPPPDSGMGTLALAWLVGALALGIAIFAGLRWRSRG